MEPSEEMPERTGRTWEEGVQVNAFMVNVTDDGRIDLNETISRALQAARENR